MARWAWGYLVAATVVLGAGQGAAQTLELRMSDLMPSPVPGLLIAPNLELKEGEAPEAASTQPLGASLLNSYVAQGRSAGFAGLVYENRDRDHSTLPRERFPGLTFLTYAPELKKGDWDYGLAGRVAIGLPLIGNSSTALTGGMTPRSQPRYAMTVEPGPEVAYFQYKSNSLYVYPEHRDHDDRDLFPANWPYCVISQGSSSSDKPFMDALLMTLAAFSTETRARLEEEGLIAPTLQMILRRNLEEVNRDADYLTARAHPTVFDGNDIRPERMIAQAAEMQPGDIPPMVRLWVEKEDFASSAGLLGRGEQLFTTPSAIARIWRDFAWEREMVVDAGQTKDPNGRPLQFHWRVVRGEPGKVIIEPEDEEGRRARIRIAWHDDYLVPGQRPGATSSRLTSRVDIAVFADNGVSISAPAFISVVFPTQQQRTYEADEDGAMRLISLDYDAESRGAPYDPILFWSAPWVDRFHYDSEGQLTGWTRDEGGENREFDATGQPVSGESVSYRIADHEQNKVVIGDD